MKTILLIALGFAVIYLTLLASEITKINTVLQGIL